MGKSYLGPIYRPVKRGLMGGLDVLGSLRGDGSVADSAQRFWEGDITSGRLRSCAHFKDGDVFADDAERWLALGREHLALYERFARALGRTAPLGRVVEWGCGGGANAVHFAPLCQEFIGVDVADETLDECGRQVRAIGGARFTPVKIDVATPETALAAIAEPCDLYLCTYVFELIPSRAYGLELLKIARQVLADDGMAIIQIKYKDRGSLVAGRRWDYARNHANATQYAVEEFWTEAQQLGLTPELVVLVPEQPLVRDRRYAYFCLTKARS
jgi:SAM-dependent methyltransferase